MPALPELPLIRETFARGELSYSKVRALTRVCERESEAELLELARHATAAQLDRIVRAARHATAAEADELHRVSFLRWSWDDEDGSLRIEAKLPPEDGALFLRALEAARDALYEQRASAVEEESGRGSAEPQPAATPAGPNGPAEPPAPELALSSPSNAESFAALAEAALARPPTGLPGGERYQVLVHVDAETLATNEPGARVTGPGACAIADGPGISPETVRRLSCDASLVSIAERNGVPLGVGRRTRSIPPSVRRALLARDGRCQFPGCERHRFVDAHHIHHWAHGGETSLDNLVLLCRHHHRLVHEGGFSVRAGLHAGPDGWRPIFRRPDGVPIPSSPAPPPVVSTELPPARGPTLTGTGEIMDLRSCVDAVLAARSRPTSRQPAQPA